MLTVKQGVSQSAAFLSASSRSSSLLRVSGWPNGQNPKRGEWAEQEEATPPLPWAHESSGAVAIPEWSLWPWPSPRRYPDLRNRVQSRLDQRIRPQLLLSRGQVQAAAAPPLPVARGRGSDYCPQIWGEGGTVSQQVLHLLHLLRQEAGKWSTLFHYSAPALGRRHPDQGLEKQGQASCPPGWKESRAGCRKNPVWRRLSCTHKL